MKNYTVAIEKMGESVSNPSSVYPQTFTDFNKAVNSFKQAIDSYLNGVDYPTVNESDNYVDAGGLGHDYRVIFEAK
ncbi:MAG TPA: hypothetical protein VL443_30120 [Cyclobacteriaceae bacterium]|jgi:hypothetical protein|nr:hypothetical protein [Cyclobacteriaceae bacterium]